MPAIRTKTVKVRLSDQEHKELSAKADASGLTLSAMLRNHVGRVNIVSPKDTLERHRLLNRIANQLGVIARLCQDVPDLNRTSQVLIYLVAIDREVTRLTNGAEER